jgi:predicted transport protein
VSHKGHWGTGDLELPLATQADLDTAKPAIALAYEGRAAPAAPAVEGSRA